MLLRLLLVLLAVGCSAIAELLLLRLLFFVRLCISALELLLCVGLLQELVAASHGVLLLLDLRAGLLVRDVGRRQRQALIVRYGGDVDGLLVVLLGCLCEVLLEPDGLAVRANEDVIALQGIVRYVCGLRLLGPRDEVALVILQYLLVRRLARLHDALVVQLRRLHAAVRHVVRELGLSWLTIGVRLLASSLERLHIGLLSAAELPDSCKLVVADVARFTFQSVNDFLLSKAAALFQISGRVLAGRELGSIELL